MIEALLTTLLFAFAQDEAPKEEIELENAEVWGTSVLRGPVPSKRPVEKPPIVVHEWRTAGSVEDTPALGYRHAIRPAPALDEAPDAPWSPKARVTEPCAIAYASVVSETDEVRMAALSGAETLIVNGEPFVGDPSHGGDRGVPVHLRAGVNHIHALGVHGRLRLELWKPSTRMVIGTWGALPDRLSRKPNRWLTDITFPAFNASLDYAEGIHVHYGDPVPNDGEFSPYLHEWRDGGFAAPLCFHPAYCGGFPEEDVMGLEYTPASEALAPLCVFARDDDNADRQIVRMEISGSARRDSAHGYPGGPGFLSNDAIFVYASNGSPAENAASLARARFDQQRLATRFTRVGRVQSDEQYLARAAQIARLQTKPSILLYGNADTNTAWRAVLAEGAIHVGRGLLRIGAREWKRDDVSAVYLADSRDEPERQVLVVGSTGVMGARFGALTEPSDPGLARAGRFIRPGKRGEVLALDR